MPMRMADIIDVSGLQKEVERRAGASGLRSSFSSATKVAYIQGNCIYCPALPVPFNMDDFKIVRMSYIHELGHWYNKEAMALREEFPVKLNTNLGATWNILQDELDEKITARAYPGDAKALGEGHAIFMYRQLEWVVDVLPKDPSKLSEDDVKKLAVLMLAKSTRDWDTFAPPVLMAMRRKLPAKISWLHATLMGEGWDDKIAALKTGQEVLDLAKKLVKRLWPEEDPDKQCQDAKDGEGGGAGSAEDGEGKTKKAKASKGDKGKPEEGENDTLKVIPWDKLVFKNHHQDEMLSAQASHIDWTGYKSERVFEAATPDQYTILNVYNGAKDGDKK